MSTAAGTSAKTTENYSVFNTFAILSMWFLFTSLGAVSPGLNAILAQYPGTSYSTISMISTIVALTSLPTTLIAGLIAEKKASFKAICVAGIAVGLVSNVVCAFAPSVAFILICRGLFGLSMGLWTALCAPYILRGYTPGKASKIMGIATASNYVGAVILQLIAGFLAAYKGTYVFLVYAVYLLVLIIIILWLPTNPPVDESMLADAEAQKLSFKIPGEAWALAIILLVIFALGFTFFIYAARVMDMRGLSNPAWAGYVLSIDAFGGIFAGLATNKWLNGLKRWSLPVCILAVAICFLILGYVSSLAAFLIFGFLLGFFYSILFPIVNLYAGFVCKPSEVTAAGSVLVITMNVGSFVSTFWASAASGITSSAGGVFTVTAIAMGILAIVVFVIKAAGKLEGSASYAGQGGADGVGVA